MSIWKNKLWALLITAILTVVAGVLVILMKPEAVPENREWATRLSCGANLSALGKAIQFYADDSDGRLPAAEKWCDSLVEHTHTPGRYFLCKAVDANEGQSCYAMNEKVAGRRLYSLPSDVVLLFESKPGWNKVGGPGMLAPDIHEGNGSNVLFVNGDVRCVKAEDANGLKWDVWDCRRPEHDDDLRYWLGNMAWYHGFSNDEIRTATGLTEKEIDAANERFDIRPGNRPKRSADAPILVLPYPGGRHSRIGFLEGAIDPQRETKFSVFAPWDANSYVVVDVPEAIWSNLGLTYLAHTHIDTIWTKQGIELEKLEWNRHPDGRLDIMRTLPNGIAFGVEVEPTKEAGLMEMWLLNGTDKKLTGLRIQNCVMTKMAKGFEQQTNENKVLTNPYVACKSSDGKRWIITAWEGCHNPWANDKCPCFHSDPKFPDLEPGQKETLKGWLSFYEGEDIEGEFKRIEATHWRQD
ncbi:MAG: hypothetical protein ACYS8Z_04965 [Planctomycetota bacterium]|jgi:hypothetical protein